MILRGASRILRSRRRGWRRRLSILEGRGGEFSRKGRRERKGNGEGGREAVEGSGRGRDVGMEMRGY